MTAMAVAVGFWRKHMEKAVTLMCFMFAAVGGILLLIVPNEDRWERQRRLGYGFFSGGMAGILISFLIKNPNVLESARENIALTILGLLIAFLQIIRLAKK